MKGKDIDAEVSGLRLSYGGRETIEAAPVRGAAANADVSKYKLSYNATYSLIVAHLDFGDKHDVRCLEFTDGTPECLHRLTHGLRMSIKRDPSLQLDWVELSQARLKNKQVPTWSNLRCATQDQLDQGAGLEVGPLLRQLGAEYGSREEVLGETNRRRGYICAVFPEGDHRVPLIAYAVTRVLALLNAEDIED